MFLFLSQSFVQVFRFDLYCILMKFFRYIPYIRNRQDISVFFILIHHNMMFCQHRSLPDRLCPVCMCYMRLSFFIMFQKHRNIKKCIISLFLLFRQPFSPVVNYFTEFCISRKTGHFIDVIFFSIHCLIHLTGNQIPGQINIIIRTCNRSYYMFQNIDFLF